MGSQVIIYGSQYCHYCMEAKKLAAEYQLDIIWHDTTLKTTQREFREKFPDAKTIPQIIWNGNYIGGYDEFSTEIENTIGGYGENI